MSRPKTFTPGESCCRFLCSLVTWQTQHHCNGIALALSEGIYQKPAEENANSWCIFPNLVCYGIAECQCSPKRRHKKPAQGICEVFKKAFPVQFGINWPHGWISEEVTAWSGALQVSPSLQQTGIPTLQPSHKTAHHECFLSVCTTSDEIKLGRSYKLIPLCKHDIRIPCS